MIFFRADANPEIGSGHIMRCLSIASALKARGAACRFILADAYAQPLVKQAGFPFARLNTDYRNMEGELSPLAVYMNLECPEWIIVDGYYVTEAYFKQLQTLTRTAYIDDFAEHGYALDALINYNIGASEFAYPSLYQNQTRLLLDVEYAPLRAEFRCLQRRIKPECTNLLILTGGADPLHVGSRLLDALLLDPEIAKMRLHIVVGALSQDAARIKVIASRHENVIVHRNVTRMAELMLSCDAAVSASGSTLYELCACGVPTVCYTVADNQLLIAKGFAARGMMRYAGDFRQNATLVLNSIVDGLRRILGNPEERTLQSNNMQKLIDGCGAQRIAEALMR